MAKTIEIKLPNGKTAEIELPDTATENDIANSVAEIAGHPQHQPSAPVGDFQSNLNQLAPSNVLKNAGVVSANAPGATQVAASLLPGGDPNQMMQGMRNVAQNPQQIPQAMGRMAQVNAGQPMTDQERPLGTAGTIAGSGIEMTAPALGISNLGGKTPFQAGMANPSLALPGAVEKAGEALGPIKSAAINNSPKLDTEMLRRMADDPKSLADYAVQRLKNLGDSPIHAMSDAELLAYNEALGQVQSKGKTWADTYKNARDAIQAIMQAQNPELFTKMKQFSQAALSRAGSSFRFPWMIGALNPAEGAIKAGVSAGMSAAGQRTAGAAVGLAARNPGKISALLDAYNKLAKKREQ